MMTTGSEFAMSTIVLLCLFLFLKELRGLRQGAPYAQDTRNDN